MSPSDLHRREVLQAAAATGVAGVAAASGVANVAEAAGGDTKVAKASQAPAFFVSHGPPWVALGREAYQKSLREFGDALEGVRGIVAISAHWETANEVRVYSSPKPRLAYEPLPPGMPPELGRLSYPCPGDPQLGKNVVDRLSGAGFKVVADPERGLDHGVSVPLLLSLPAAKIPVVQVSLLHDGSSQDLFRMGEALRSLRSEGIMIMGTGGMVHNLRRVLFHDQGAPIQSWAKEFDAWAWEKLNAKDHANLLDWKRAPNAELAHPTPEHWLPFYFVLGAALPEDRINTVYEGFYYGNLSMRTFALRT